MKKTFILWFRRKWLNRIPTTRDLDLRVFHRHTYTHDVRHILSKFVPLCHYSVFCEIIRKSLRSVHSVTRDEWGLSQTLSFIGAGCIRSHWEISLVFELVWSVGDTTCGKNERLLNNGYGEFESKFIDRISLTVFGENIGMISILLASLQNTSFRWIV